MAELAHVMVVEDEKGIRDLLTLHLSRQGYQVTECATGEEAMASMQVQDYALYVLDWMLPGKSGIDLVENLRQRNSEAKVLMVTAKTEPQDIVDGLEKGADDYLTKPFDPRILMARVKALLRRGTAVQARASDIIEFDQLKINTNSFEAFLASEPLHLTPSEFKLLQTLLENLGRVWTRDQLMEQIQGESVHVVGRTIDTHVFGLRKKLGAWGDRIETIRGVGYRVKVDLLE